MKVDTSGLSSTFDHILATAAKSSGHIVEITLGDSFTNAVVLQLDSTETEKLLREIMSVVKKKSPATYMKIVKSL